MKSLLAFIVVIAVGVVGYLYWHKNYTNGGKPANEPVVEEIKRGDIEEKISASGKVEAKGGLYYVLAETNGKIVKGAAALTVGKPVKEGELLLQLDDTKSQYEVNLAEAAVKTANGDLEKAKASQIANKAKINAVERELEWSKTKLENAQNRKQDLAAGQLKDFEKEFEKNEAASKAAYALENVSLAEISTALANVTRAEAGLTLAKRGLEQTRITAPCSGIILEINKYVKDGQLIGPQAGPLVTISPNPDQWEIKAQISEQDIGKILTRLNSGEAIPVRFTTEAYSAERQIKFTGHVMKGGVAAMPTAPQRPSFGGGQEALLFAAMGGAAASSSGPANYTVTVGVDPIPEDIRKTHPLFVGYTATDLQIILKNYKNIVCVPSAALAFTPEGLSDPQQRDLKKSEDEGWSTIWFWNSGGYEAKHIKAGASEEGRTQVLEVKDGKPEDLLNKSVVTEGPKKVEKNSLFGEGGPKFKIPG